MINLHLLNIDVLTGKDLKVSVEASELNGSYFEIEGGTQLVERKMLGELDKVERYEIGTEENTAILGRIVDSLTIYAQNLARDYANRKEGDRLVKVKVVYEVATHGDMEHKHVSVFLYELKLYLVTARYLNLVKFVELDESVKPPLPKGIIEGNLLLDESAKMRPVHKEEAGQSSITVNVLVKNILITMPSSMSGTNYSPNVLAVRGILSFFLFNY